MEFPVAYLLRMGGTSTGAPLTFDEDDKLGRTDFADRLTGYVQTERDWVDGSLVISLNGKFGSGKTTFFRMWENRLKDQDDAPAFLYLNAWKSDFAEEPLVAMALQLEQRLKE